MGYIDLLCGDDGSFAAILGFADRLQLIGYRLQRAPA
jgi:hypothetical protein